MGRLTAHRVRCLHFDRGARLRLPVSRYQQFIRKICICVYNPRLRGDTDRYCQPFKWRNLQISWKTKCEEGGRLLGSAPEGPSNSESRGQDGGALAGLEAETGLRD